MRVTAPGGWGRRPEVDAPGGPRPTPGARWRCQLDPSHPQFVTRHRLPLNQAGFYTQAWRQFIGAVAIVYFAAAVDVAGLCLARQL